MEAPGLSIFCSLTSTRPARMSARARSRLGTSPRSTSRTSIRDFGEAGIAVDDPGSGSAEAEKTKGPLRTPGMTPLIESRTGSSLRGRRRQSGTTGEGRRRRGSGQIAGLTVTRLAAGVGGIAAGGILGAHPHVHDVSLYQH